MLRVAIAQFRPRKADYPTNLARAGEVFGSLAGEGPAPDLLVFPESALTGYFLEGGVQEAALPAERLYDDLSGIHAGAGGPPVDVVVGFYELWRKRIHNSALVATLGGPEAGIRHVHRKIFLPTYGVFDEERFVEPGLTVEGFDLGWGRAAAIVCEDAWHSLVPTIAALDGAQCLVVVSASPARGVGPDRNATGGPNPALVNVTISAAELAAFQKGIA